MMHTLDTKELNDQTTQYWTQIYIQLQYIFDTSKSSVSIMVPEHSQINL